MTYEQKGCVAEEFFGVNIYCLVTEIGTWIDRAWQDVGWYKLVHNICMFSRLYLRFYGPRCGRRRSQGGVRNGFCPHGTHVEVVNNAPAGGLTRVRPVPQSISRLDGQSHCQAGYDSHESHLGTWLCYGGCDPVHDDPCRDGSRSQPEYVVIGCCHLLPVPRVTG